jgi:hypothetical protein
MDERWHDHVTRSHLPLIIVVGCLSAFPATALFQSRQRTPVNQTNHLQTRKLYRIEVEDADEAGLIQQELKIKPEVVRGRYFYYFGDEDLNRRLIAYGYSPIAVAQDEIFSRVVRITPSKDESAVLRSGVKIVLRERDNWYVRGTTKQLEVLSHAGFKFAETGDKPLVPRRIQIQLRLGDDVNKQIGGRVEINSVRQSRRGITVIGEAFDDAIAELRARSLKVEILPDYPGVVR